MVTEPWREPIRRRLSTLIQQGDWLRKNVPEIDPASSPQVQSYVMHEGGQYFKQSFVWVEQVWQVLRLDAPDLTHEFDNQAVPELTFDSLREYLIERVKETKTIMDKLPPA